MLRYPQAFAVVILGTSWLGGAGEVVAQPPGPQPAKMRLLVPMANAEVTLEGRATRQTGERREFVSPPLDPAKQYSYTVVVVWRPNNYTTMTRTREITVRAGQEVQLDLRLADDKHPDKVVVRYVPTPMEVVEAMLKLAEVGKEDIVYDLGCGDGRIVVTAVAKFGARRGIGVDIDPERIKDSQATAKEAKVEGRVEFRQADVLTISDYGDATVVMLYMGEELNLRLRPILQKTLKPGSRIVSHRFTLGDWKPHKTITVSDTEGDEYLLHLWIVGKDGEGKEQRLLREKDGPMMFARFNLGPMEMMIILGVGVLLFGRRLPEVGRVLGRIIVKLKQKEVAKNVALVASLFALWLALVWLFFWGFPALVPRRREGPASPPAP